MKKGEKGNVMNKKKSDEKRLRKTWVKEKHKNAESFILKIRKSFFKERDTKRKKLIKHVFVRKNASLEWKRIEKRKGRSFRKEETFFFWKMVKQKFF